MSQSNNYNGNYMEMFSDDEPNTEECQTCDGKGSIDTVFADPDDPTETLVDSERCLTCDGEGWVLTDSQPDPDAKYDDRMHRLWKSY